MTRLSKGSSLKAGSPPGTLVHIGERKREKAVITLLEYNEGQYKEEVFETLQHFSAPVNKDNLLWVNVDGIHQVEVLERIGDAFGLHPLVMEDIANSGQRSKIEDYGEYVYMVAKVLSFDKRTGEIVSEQISLVLGKGYVLTFNEKQESIFSPVRDRIINGTGRIRKEGADYLAYSLLDAIVDDYFVLLEEMGDRMEKTEEGLVKKPTRQSLKLIQQLRRMLLFLHKSVWPMREAIGFLEKRETFLVEESTGVFFRDVYDHLVQVMETTETYRDTVSGMMEIYLSGMSNRMNEIIKVLTIISTIFMPLTFIVGVYGMNFRHMPELEQSWGYPGVLVLMALTAGLMLYYFKKKDWI